MSSTKRIFLNIFATYGQSLFSFVLGVFCSRWIFNALGSVDFGLFSLVGSLIGFVTFLRTALSVSSSRHFAFAIGEAKQKQSDEARELLRTWFNNALSIHFFLPLTLVLIGLPFGDYMINHVLDIPHEALQTCVSVFRISLFTAFAAMLFVPFNAIYTAKQLIFVRNISAVIRSILFALAGWWLLHYSGNRLLFYSILVFGITILVDGSLALLAMYAFPECRIRLSLWFDKNKTKELFAYATYNSVETIGHVLRTQGVAIVLNTKFGPVINAANGIGNQVTSKIGILPGALLSAVSPEITTSYGQTNYKRAKIIGTRISFYGATLTLIVAIPLIVFIEHILILWLKTPPKDAGAFCMIALLLMMTDKVALGHKMLVQAHGDIRNMQIVSGTLYLFSILAVWVLVKTGLSGPVSAAVGILIPAFLAAVSKVWFAKKLVGISFREWICNSISPLIFMATISTAICLLVRFYYTSIYGFLLSSVISFPVVILSFFFFLDKEERRFFIQKSKKLFKIYSDKNIKVNN